MSSLDPLHRLPCGIIGLPIKGGDDVTSTRASENIEQLIHYAVAHELMGHEDIIPTRNALMDVMGVPSTTESLPARAYRLRPIEEILQDLITEAVNAGLIQDTSASRDLFDTKIMGLLLPRASEVCRHFSSLQTHESIEKATEWFYRFCQSSNYIRMDRIRKNHHWIAPSLYGNIEITINLSKPEKDPRDIAAQKKLPQVDYPRCLLCIENEGYPGRIDHPARQNLRLIPLELDGERWYFQYSPYVYYNEHCIVIDRDHQPMEISEQTFVRFLDFLDQFPHYFIGSNADLPIVGGSILSHEHFQGGRHSFPMEKAANRLQLIHPAFPSIQATTLHWPLSTLRIRSTQRQEIVRICAHVLHLWRSYSDPETQILDHTDHHGERIFHNTITPIARCPNRGIYEVDLVLRNNRTSDEHLLGIFHPHSPRHHIKKENIGLIEVLGLAILPGRLDQELKQISSLLCGDVEDRERIQKDFPVQMEVHGEWIERLKKEHPHVLTPSDAERVIQTSVAEIFIEVLKDCGVFKENDQGSEGWNRFLADLGFCVISDP